MWTFTIVFSLIAALLLPLERQSNYLLAGLSATPDSLLLQEGARPNDGNYPIAFLEEGNNGYRATSARTSHGEDIEFQTIPPLSRTDYQNEVPRYAYRAAPRRPAQADFLYR